VCVCMCMCVKKIVINPQSKKKHIFICTAKYKANFNTILLFLISSLKLSIENSIKRFQIRNTKKNSGEMNKFCGPTMAGTWPFQTLFFTTDRFHRNLSPVNDTLVSVRRLSIPFLSVTKHSHIQ